jgi:hypothetical protein
MALQAQLRLGPTVGRAAQEPTAAGSLVVSLNSSVVVAAVVLLDMLCEKTAKQ